MKTLIISLLFVSLGLTSCVNPLICFNKKTNEFKVENRYYISKIMVSINKQYYDTTIFEIECIDSNYGVSQISILESPKGYHSIGILNDSIIKKLALKIVILAKNKKNEAPHTYFYKSEPDSKDSIKCVKPLRMI